MRLHNLGAMGLENTKYVRNLVPIKVSLLIYLLRSSYISLFTTWINIYNKNIISNRVSNQKLANFLSAIFLEASIARAHSQVSVKCKN